MASSFRFQLRYREGLPVYQMARRHVNPASAGTMTRTEPPSHRRDRSPSSSGRARRFGGRPGSSGPALFDGALVERRIVALIRSHREGGVFRAWAS